VRVVGVFVYTDKGKSNMHLRRDHKVPEEEQKYKLYFYINLGARWRWGEWEFNATTPVR
jgi:hypothetical protein